MEDKLKNMMRIFLDSIRDYEHESGNKISDDERCSEEFVEIFVDSNDAFEYEELIKILNGATVKRRELIDFLTWFAGNETMSNVNDLEKIVDIWLQKIN